MILLAFTTFADEPSAAGTVRSLVSERLAACGTLLPGARSIYRWQGAVEDNPEVVVLFKLAASSREAFLARLKDLHPYEVPEILLFAPEHWHEAYARWVLESSSRE